MAVVRKRFPFKVPKDLHRLLVASPHVLAFGPEGCMAKVALAPLLRIIAGMPQSSWPSWGGRAYGAGVRNIAQLVEVARRAVILARYGEADFGAAANPSDADAGLYGGGGDDETIGMKAGLVFLESCARALSTPPGHRPTPPFLYTKIRPK